jgi:hypothetical protein
MSIPWSEEHRPSSEGDERGERPLRDAEREQRPVHHAALARPAQDAAQSLYRAERGEQMIERRAAAGTSFWREVLKPHMTSRDRDAEHRDERDRSALEACADTARRMM